MRHKRGVREQFTWPDVMTLTKEVFPEALLECGRCWGVIRRKLTWRPTTAISAVFEKKSLEEG